MKIGRILLMSLFLAVLPFALFSVPAKRDLITITQSDGKQLGFYIKGDENSNHRETTDGYWLLENEQGDMVYALQPTASGTMAASNLIAHNPDERTLAEIVFLQSIDKNVFNVIRKKAFGSGKSERIIRNKGKSSLASMSTAKVLIILAEFSDVKFKVPNPQNSFSDQLNTLGYTGNGHIGSARDYFRENSLDAFDPQFDVVGPVTLSNMMRYYGENVNSIPGYDKRPGTMVAEAAMLAKDLADFSQYDLDKDGEVDNLIVLYAGFNEAEGASIFSIWPHAWKLSSAALEPDDIFTIPVIDGVKIETYACTSELSGRSSSNMSGIGTICHEFAHVLGLPDVYDTDYEKNGLAPAFCVWSLMDFGNSLKDGKMPPYLTAYERELLGWGTVTILEEPGNYSLEHVNTGQIYRINSSVANEYFLLENRQQTRWDSYLPGHGMLITHVDMTDRSYFENNTLNAYADHERIDLKEADGAKKSGIKFVSSASDPFPGSTNKTSFTDTTSPANSVLWNGSGLNKPIFNITETDGKIYFNFIEEEAFARPVALDATSKTSNSFTANWHLVNGAQSYFIDVYTKTPGNQSVVLDETFTGISVAASGEILSEENWSGIGLNGWTGTKVYPGYSGAGSESNKVVNALKFGSSSVKSGEVIFPVSMNGNSTITISAKDWEGTSGGDGAVYTVYHDAAGGSNFETVSTSASLHYTAFEEQSFEIAGGTSASKIKIEITGGRAFINRINIVSGTPDMISYIPNYLNVDAGNVNQFQVTELPTNNTYYYVVRAFDGTLTSRNSNEIAVSLQETSISNPSENDEYRIYRTGNMLFVEADNALAIEVYTVLGQLIVKKQGNQGINKIELTNNMIYIVKLAGKTIKVSM